MVSANITAATSYFSNVVTTTKVSSDSKNSDFSEIMKKSNEQKNTVEDVSKKKFDSNAEEVNDSKEQNRDVDKVDRKSEGEEKIKNTSDEMKNDKDCVGKTEESFDESEVVEAIQAMQISLQSINDIKTQIADILGITEDELSGILEELKMNVQNLSDPENIMQLVMKAKGINDATVLLVDESIVNDVNEILGQIEELIESNQMSEDTVYTESNVTDDNASEMYDASNKELHTENITEQENLSLNIKGDMITEKLDNMSNDTDAHSKKQEGNKDDSLQNLNIGNVNQNNITGNIAEALVSAGADFEEAKIISQIIDQINVNAKQNITSMEMQLYPEHLGKVTIQVVAKDGGVTAQIQAENENVVKAIEGQISILRDSLNNQGVKIDSIEVTIASHGFEQNLDDSQRENRNGENNARKIRRNISESFENEEVEEISESAVMETIGNTVSYKA